MTFKSKLGDILAAIYLCTAVVILFRWATNISPVIEAGWFIQQDSHNLLEVVIIFLPFVPVLLLSAISGSYQDTSYTLDTVVFVEPFETVLMIGIVILNAVCWYVIGYFLESLFLKIKTLLKNRNQSK